MKMSHIQCRKSLWLLGNLGTATSVVKNVISPKLEEISGEQFLYRNSVSPYCFPLPTVLLFIYLFFLYYVLYSWCKVLLNLNVNFLFKKGMTLAVENGELVVARIIHGGMIDRQGTHCTFLHHGHSMYFSQSFSSNLMQIMSVSKTCLSVSTFAESLIQCKLTVN